MKTIQLTMAAIALGAAVAGAASAPAAVDLAGLDGKTVKVTLESVKKMPAVEIPAVDPHSQKKLVYRGTPLANVLKLAHAPLGEKLKRQALRVYVEIAAEDGYTVLYSLAELDPETGPSDVYLAYEVDGKALGDGVGPLRTVVPSETAGKRWVRMVSKISLKSAP
jgi:DMSO/TMAO reductase YedYZ molybdopterin-dependent catalytic subunit